MWHQYLYIAALIGTVVCLMFFLSWIKKRPTINSTFIGFGIWIASSFIMLFLEPFIFAPTGDVGLDRFIWYSVFAVIDCMAIFFINSFHRQKNIQLNRDSLLICLSLFVLMSLQVLRYCDRALLELNLLESAYKNGVPTINIITWAYIVAIVVIELAKKNKKGRVDV